MKQFLVYDFEVLHRRAGYGIGNPKFERDGARAGNLRRIYAQVHRILDRLRQIGH